MAPFFTSSDLLTILESTVLARVDNEERVSNAPQPCRKHSRESNVIVTRPKMARYDVYTLIKIGIDRRGLLPSLPQCLQEILRSEESEKLAELTAQQLELRYPPTSSLYCMWE